MIEVKRDRLVFSFPEVHPEARLSIAFERTLRIPDDDRDYPLPPGLGEFPLRHVDDFDQRVPAQWIEHGGVMLPMYQSEALWLNFHASRIRRRGAYAFLVKVGTGKICAVSGQPWSAGLCRDPQNYLVVPEQPWLDGYCVAEGVIRQFVAMPLGVGYTAEEQLTGRAEHGGLQIAVHPMTREAFERHFPEHDDRVISRTMEVQSLAAPEAVGGMGLAPGGRMKQQILDDPYDTEDWARQTSSRCFVHIANSLVWHGITGEQPPTVPPTAEDYSRRGLPWFDYYSDEKTRPGADRLAGMKSVATLGKQNGDAPLPENTSVSPDNIITLRRGLEKGQVREGTF